jgi:hypothetical protein
MSIISLLLQFGKQLKGFVVATSSGLNIKNILNNYIDKNSYKFKLMIDFEKVKVY